MEGDAGVDTCTKDSTWSHPGVEKVEDSSQAPPVSSRSDVSHPDHLRGAVMTLECSRSQDVVNTDPVTLVRYLDVTVRVQQDVSRLEVLDNNFPIMETGEDLNQLSRPAPHQSKIIKPV